MFADPPTDPKLRPIPQRIVLPQELAHESVRIAIEPLRDDSIQNRVGDQIRFYERGLVEDALRLRRCQAAFTGFSLLAITVVLRRSRLRLLPISPVEAGQGSECELQRLSSGPAVALRLQREVQLM